MGDQLCNGSMVEVVEDTPGARHPMEPRGLEAGDRFFIKSHRNGVVTYASMAGDLKITADRVRVVPTVGGETARDDLQIEHGRSDEWFVYRKSDHAVLCQGTDPGYAPFKLYRPLVWGEHAKAEAWVKDGVIADLQEALGNLDIRFTKVMVVSRR